jgi:ketosteroid isomerase-like protein
MSASEDVVRAMFDAYRTGDRAAAEKLLAPALVFTTPQDDHIDRAAYFERCFPTAERFARQEIRALAVAGNGVFVMYEYELADSGETYRNTELHTVIGQHITEIQVFFGGRV